VTLAGGVPDRLWERGAQGSTSAPDGAGAEVFSGAPELRDDGAALFDSDREGDRRLLPAHGVTLTGVLVRFLDGAPEPQSIDARIALLLFAGDMAVPRARMRVRDVVRQGGERPLNVAVGAGERVRLVLDDPAGAWAGQAPRLAVTLRW
jgi:hypothetical protein